MSPPTHWSMRGGVDDLTIIYPPTYWSMRGGVHDSKIALKQKLIKTLPNAALSFLGLQFMDNNVNAMSLAQAHR